MIILPLVPYYWEHEEEGERDCTGLYNNVSTFFINIFKQKALWKIEQNIRAIYWYQNLYLILVHGHQLHLEIVCV